MREMEEKQETLEERLRSQFDNNTAVSQKSATTMLFKNESKTWNTC